MSRTATRSGTGSGVLQDIRDGGLDNEGVGMQAIERDIAEALDFLTRGIILILIFGFASRSINGAKSTGALILVEASAVAKSDGELIVVVHDP